MTYTPSVSEGVYPEDAGWAHEGETEILLLSVPLPDEVFHVQNDTFDYAWLYNQSLDSYIFCFKLPSRQEFGILFQREHAGMLLMEEEAYGEFTIVVTNQSFEEIKENTPFLTLSNISLKRTIAGW